MRTTDITRETTLCMSLAGRPSSRGTRFHNYLYSELGLNFVYKAFTTSDLPAAIAGVRALGVRGCAISMPFKQDVIGLVDSLDASALAIGAVNTIVNSDSHLRAYNTDYSAVASLLRTHGVDPATPFAVLGSGGMAKAVVAALRDGGFATGSVVSRNEATGRALAEAYGYAWTTRLRAGEAELIVNATPIGMAGANERDLPAPEPIVRAATTVFDVVAMPPHTPLIRLAADLGKQTITGDEVMDLQAVEQFVLYTGVRPDEALVRAASEFARSG